MTVGELRETMRFLDPDMPLAVLFDDAELGVQPYAVEVIGTVFYIRA